MDQVATGGVSDIGSVSNNGSNFNNGAARNKIDEKDEDDYDIDSTSNIGSAWNKTEEEDKDDFDKNIILIQYIYHQVIRVHMLGDIDDWASSSGSASNSNSASNSGSALDKTDVEDEWFSVKKYF
ncbi:unnamed protein product [Gordionus sp. m RMFG-2023]